MKHLAFGKENMFLMWILAVIISILVFTTVLMVSYVTLFKRAMSRGSGQTSGFIKKIPLAFIKHSTGMLCVIQFYSNSKFIRITTCSALKKKKIEGFLSLKDSGMLPWEIFFFFEHLYILLMSS